MHCRARSFVFATIVSVGLIATACGSTPRSTVATEQTEVSTGEPASCGTGFVPHDLEHTTSGPGDTSSTFDGTGAGVGVGDLDLDGDLDIVLANLSGTSSILENNGDLNFTRHELEAGRFRGVAIINATNDTWPDIVMTTGLGTPVIYPNPGTGQLEQWERTVLDDVSAIAYSMAWTDLGGDGDLDLVTGSYNAELTFRRNSPVLGDNTGVILHEMENGRFETTRLSDTAQALALVTADIDGDGAQDIYVGNDLATPDFIWLSKDGGWEERMPFTTSSFSTMSIDAADIDNDGRNEFFTTDMAPPAPDDRYREVDEDMAAMPVVDDIQTPVNVLNDPAANDLAFSNMASGQPIETTGWSWSGLFGDLDNDGFQDLYVANGMRSDVLFGFLPDARLVEENQAFQNIDGTLVEAPDWALNATEGGRGMTMADLDSDGDLDIIINNLDTPSRVFENQLCGNSLQVDLTWTGTENIDALGATVAVELGDQTLTREITSSRGYLSSAPPVAHFGLGDAQRVDLTVTWPDGEITRATNVATNRVVTLTR